MKASAELAHNDRHVQTLLHLYRRKDVTDSQRESLGLAMNELDIDDAVHVMAPWDTRVTLCGGWWRNRVSLDEKRPDGMAGCWTCLMAAEWFDKNINGGEDHGNTPTT